LAQRTALTSLMAKTTSAEPVVCSKILAQMGARMEPPRLDAPA